MAAPDPDDYFGRTFQTGGATNVFKYSNPEAGQDPDRQARSATGGARARRCMTRRSACSPATGRSAHLAYGTLFAAERTNVQGFRLNPTRSLLGLRDVTLAKGAAKE